LSSPRHAEGFRVLDRSLVAEPRRPGDRAAHRRRQRRRGDVSISCTRWPSPRATRRKHACTTARWWPSAIRSCNSRLSTSSSHRSFRRSRPGSAAAWCLPPRVYNPDQVWASIYQAHSDELLGATSEFSRALSMSAVPSTFWRGAPLDQLEAYVKAHTPSTASVYVARGMERARSALALRDRLVPAADAYVAAHHS